jgi:hypothetical protein
MSVQWLVIDCGDGLEHVIPLSSVKELYTTRRNGDVVCQIEVESSGTYEVWEISEACYENIKGMLI